MITADAVIFDVDDTLYLERDYVRSGFLFLEDWCQRSLDVSGVGAGAWELFERGVRGSTLTDALAERGVVADDDLRRQVIEAYRSHPPTIELLPDAARCLDRIQSSVHLGAVTDGPAASQQAKVEALGLGRWIRHVVITEELGTSKPDPRVFRHVADAVGAQSGSFVYVADNPAKDFKALPGLGWRGIRIRRPGSLHEEVPTPPGVAEITDLDELEVMS